MKKAATSPVMFSSRAAPVIHVILSKARTDMRGTVLAESFYETQQFVGWAKRNVPTD
jgi:hypothetical protein